MNDVNPKEHLLKLQRLNTNINQKIAELDSLRLMCTSIKSPSFDSDKVQTGGSGDAPFVRQIEKIKRSMLRRSVCCHECTQPSK